MKSLLAVLILCAAALATARFPGAVLLAVVFIFIGLYIAVAWKGDRR